MPRIRLLHSLILKVRRQGHLEFFEEEVGMIMLITVRLLIVERLVRILFIIESVSDLFCLNLKNLGSSQNRQIHLSTHFFDFALTVKK